MSGEDAMFLCMVAFWIGFAVRRWGEKRKAKSEAELSWEAFGEQARKGMLSLRTNRKFVGAGPSIQQTGIWTLNGVGKFRVTIEEVEGETIDG